MDGRSEAVSSEAAVSKKRARVGLIEAIAERVEIEPRRLGAMRLAAAVDLSLASGCGEAAQSLDEQLDLIVPGV
jgi:hypothetical protein